MNKPRAPEPLTPNPEHRKLNRRRCDADRRAIEADLRTYIAHVEDRIKEAELAGAERRIFAPLTMRFIADQRERLSRLEADCRFQ
ncbi:MAG: hypothetical protein MSG64_16790 [Pyrinomonadaceae bacterium MAG19_C2-C3]|nr:hypothetical protein [Pyrinomonadaceae bacterium MAG19_C2-C3]